MRKKTEDEYAENEKFDSYGNFCFYGNVDHFLRVGFPFRRKGSDRQQRHRNEREYTCQSKGLGEITEKLLSGTSGEHKKEAYLFDSGYWRILIKEDNLSVSFPSDDNIKDCFDRIFGENERNADSFSYNPNEETIVFGFYGARLPEGELNAVVYSMEQGEFYLLIDGQYYEPSDEFVGYMQDYGLMEVVRAQMRGFWKDLDNMDLTEEDLKKLDYNELKDAYVW